MPVTDLLVAVGAAALGVAALWLLRRRGGVDRGGPRGELILYVGIAGVASLVCAIMNILEVLVGGVTSAAIGNATNVFAPAMMWACARRMNGRRGIGVVTAAASSLLMLATTFVVALDSATLIKTGAIALFAFLATVEFRRAPVRTRPGAASIAVALGVFGAYNVGRLVIAGSLGTGSGVWNALASAEATSIVSAVVILVVSIAALRLGRTLPDDPEPGTRAYGRTSLRRRGLDLLSGGDRFVGLTLRVPDLDLIRAAHGPERAEAVLTQLLSATRDALPTAAAGSVSRDTIAVLLPGDAERAGIDREIAERFAARNPLGERAGTPDIRIVYRGVSDREQLTAFLGDAGRRHRPDQPAFDG